MKGTMILIEGLDLAGKSSACKALVARMKPRHELRRNAFTGRNPLYTIADRLRRTEGLTEEYLGHAYLAAAAMDLALFRTAPRPRIQESTIALRSMAYYRARGQTVLADGFTRLLDDPAFPAFSRTVVLTASIEARRARLEMRRREAPDEVAPDDLAVLRTPDLFLAMEEVIVREVVCRYDAHIIDTSDLTKAEVVTAIVEALATTAVKGV